MAFTSVIKGLHTNSLYLLNLFLSRWAWKAWMCSDWRSRNWERSRRVSAETADLLKTGGLQLHRVEGGWGERDSVSAVTFQQTNLDHHGLPFAALSTLSQPRHKASRLERTSHSSHNHLCLATKRSEMSNRSTRAKAWDEEDGCFWRMFAGALL